MANPKPKESESGPTLPQIIIEPASPKSEIKSKPLMSHKLAIRKERQGQ